MAVVHFDNIQLYLCLVNLSTTTIFLVVVAPLALVICLLKRVSAFRQSQQLRAWATLQKKGIYLLLLLFARACFLLFLLAPNSVLADIRDKHLSRFLPKDELPYVQVCVSIESIPRFIREKVADGIQ